MAANKVVSVTRNGDEFGIASSAFTVVMSDGTERTLWSPVWNEFDDAEEEALAWDKARELYEDVITLREIFTPLSFKPFNVGIGRIPEGLIKEYGLNMNPDYQRGSVWSLRQKRAYVGYILEGGETLPLILNIPDSGAAYSELIDGKQRLTAICEWISGEFNARLYDGREVSYKILEADPVSKRLMNSAVMLTIGTVCLPRRKAIEYYLKLNGAGSPHTDAELQHARTLLSKLGDV